MAIASNAIADRQEIDFSDNQEPLKPPLFPFELREQWQKCMKKIINIYCRCCLRLLVEEMLDTS